MITNPRAIRKRPSATNINGILSVGLSMRVIDQPSSFLLISVVTNRDDFGIRGVHDLSTRSPPMKSETENYSMKLFERPTPMKVTAWFRA